MSRGKMAGAGGDVTVYYGTIAGALGIGPLWSLEYICVNGKKTEFKIQLGSADYIDGSIPDYGSFRLYGGTETQNPDPNLDASGQLHSAYRGIVYIVLLDFSFGKNGETNPPNIEVCWRKLPHQLIVSNSGGAASNDGAYTANPICCAAELLTSWDWASLPDTRLNAATFQSAADALETIVPKLGSPFTSGSLVIDRHYEITNHVAGDDFTNVGAPSNATGVRFRASGTTPSGWSNGSVLTPVGERSFAAVSPFWNEQTDLRAALADLAAISGAWFRTGVDGRIEAGYWKRDGSLTGVPALTISDLTEDPEIEVAETDTLPNSFVVEFRDAQKLHKLNCTSPFNTASVRSSGVVRQQTVKRPMLLQFDQANRHADDLLRENSIPKVSITVQVRRWRAKNVDGTPIRPGDYFGYPVQVHPNDAADVRLFRCTRRSYEPTGDITLSGELETNGAVSATFPRPPVVELPDVLPPLYHRRIIPLPPETSDDSQPVYLLASKPGDVVNGVNVHFDTSSGGDFPVIAGQQAFALPVSLNASVSAAASSLQLKLLVGGGGVDPQREAYLLREWTGGEIEGNDDTLLLILVRKDGSGNVIYNSGIPHIEVLSIAAPPSLVGDVFTVTVLRGRRGTTAKAFNVGSFPDAFANYEGWIIHRAEMTPIVHNDFATLITSQAPAYFRYSPYSRHGVYDPAEAKTERDRRVAASEQLGEYVNQTSTAHQPTDSFTFPPSALTPVVVGETAYTVDLLAPARTVACDSAGTPLVGQLGSGGVTKTTVRVARGASPLAAVPSSPNADQFSIALGTHTNASAAIEGVDVVRCDSLTGDTGAIEIIVNVAGAISFTKWFVLSKARTGTTGSTGAPGASGTSRERRYRRSAMVPATPFGNNPSGWTLDIPGGTDALWASEATKDSSGNVVGSWSTPQRLSGSVIFYTPGPPSGTLIDGDTYFDIADNYKIYRRTGGTWQAAFQPLLKLDGNNNISGLVKADGTDKDFVLVADKFQVWNGVSAEAPFEIVGGNTYIKQAFIGQVAAGKIAAGDIEVELTLGVNGSIRAGSDFGEFKVNNTELKYGVFSVKQHSSITGTEAKVESGAHHATLSAHNYGGHTAGLSTSDGIKGVVITSTGVIQTSGILAVTGAGMADFDGPLNMDAQLNVSGNNKIDFSASGGSAYLQEGYGLNLWGDSTHPIHIRNASLVRGGTGGGSYGTGNILGFGIDFNPSSGLPNSFNCGSSFGSDHAFSSYIAVNTNLGTIYIPYVTAP